MNPPKFDKVEDMADLTYLNEASVVHNLRLRYLSNLIYTYSGLFLVAVNPYHRLPIYSDSVVASYKNRKRNEMPPHVFAISDAAYHDMLQDRENQSILITGESGAGKTENTKKVIQYLTSIASERSTAHAGNGLEQQILQANPILEAFGNAQSIRNNNSSRFGKFIRIEFNTAGQIAGANIERYLLEKSRVTHQTPKERNFHIFYQLLKTTDASIKDPLLLDGTVDDYAYVKNSRKIIDGVDDTEEFKNVLKSMEVMGFTREEQHDLFRVVAAILHLGNLSVTGNATDQAQMNDTSVAERVCHVLGIPVSEFVRGLLRPKIKAGRDWVTQARNVSQVNFSIEALARALYERMFGQLVERNNIAMDRPTGKSTFIGVLDIAGFEIFETNSFEQLNINYTNEKLQQFFNHHMFVLEQEEYKREGIEWKFIDFGLDLQPTINLIEKANPIGILSCLDEECVMPQASDKTFTEKLHAIWKDKTGLYEPLRFKDGFVLKHYASKVEYNTVGWLDKNKDPLNDNITRLLAKSTERYVASLFTDYLEETIDWSTKNRAKKGVFRTVGQKYKEQLSSLMQQLYATQPHFVRCILPNEEKKPARINVPLVLDQLRCNGVLEGIRICRAGFPNRLVFAEFRQRYEILAPGVIQRGFMDGKRAAQKLLEAMQLDPSHYRIGTSKVFFRAGVLAELEEIRDIKLSSIIGNFQALCRGYLARRKHLRKKNQLLAIQTIQKNARVYVRLREWAWWRLYSKVKPLLNVTRTDEELKKREALIRDLEEKVKREGDERSQLELQRTKLETEKRQLEETLTAERNAALDQEEILKRKQETEVRLQESLRDVTAELEALEARLEEANAAKERLERELASLRQEHDDQIAQMERLERERTAKDQRIQQLMSEVQAEADLAARAINERKSVETRLTDLKQSSRRVRPERRI
ncbi:Myh11 protein [Syncephalis plumigaleata]|nr:Myh11 protein [Syncephalis plumigaleata]